MIDLSTFEWLSLVKWDCLVINWSAEIVLVKVEHMIYISTGHFSPLYPLQHMIDKYLTKAQLKKISLNKAVELKFSKFK